MSWRGSINLPGTEPHLGSGKTKAWSHTHLLNPAAPGLSSSSHLSAHFKIPYLSKDNSNPDLAGQQRAHVYHVFPASSNVFGHFLLLLLMLNCFWDFPALFNLTSNQELPLWNPAIVSGCARTWEWETFCASSDRVWHPSSCAPRVPLSC